MVKLITEKVYEDVILPQQATEGSVGLDLRAYILGEPKQVVIKPQQVVKLETGLKFQIPEGYFMQIHPRSSMGIKKNLMLANTTGIIDSDYRLPVFIFVKNIGSTDVVVEHNERLAQAIILAYPEVHVVECAVEASVSRIGGFGSTGKV